MQAATEIQEMGVHMELHVTGPEVELFSRSLARSTLLIVFQDMNRQAIKSSNAVVLIPELEFEFPTGKSELSTVEGFLTTAADNLEADQPLREVRRITNEHASFIYFAFRPRVSVLSSQTENLSFTDASARNVCSCGENDHISSPVRNRICQLHIHCGRPHWQQLHPAPVLSIFLVE